MKEVLLNVLSTLTHTELVDCQNLVDDLLNFRAKAEEKGIAKNFKVILNPLEPSLKRLVTTGAPDNMSYCFAKGEKLSAIKAVREMTGLSGKEAKELVEGRLGMEIPFAEPPLWSGEFKIEHVQNYLLTYGCHTKIITE